ncbi:transposase family protein [Streptomyces sp.]|uniref:transposase family protein n=1 Tax=Streptomyces sp. TaxID=1931 RepID=UPI0025FC1E0C|nr:transposase family protein [Streptomyces sp.]
MTVAEDTCPLDYKCRLPLSTRTVNHLADLLRRHLKAIRSGWLALLAAQAPRLDRALKKVAKQGGEVVLIDGTLIATRRRTGKADRRNHSGEHHHHGLRFLALTDERGRLIRISAARPGRTHDNTAARHGHILAHLPAAGLGALADLGFRGLDNNVAFDITFAGRLSAARQ